MLITLALLQAPTAKAQTNNPVQTQPFAPPTISIRLSQATVTCQGILTGVVKVKNMDPTHSIFVHRIVLNLGEGYSLFIYQGWSWSGNEEIKQGETGTFDWISAVRWKGAPETWVYAYAIVDYVSPVGSERGTSTQVPFTIVCPMATTTFTHKETTGIETITEISTETTPVQTSENCFSYLLRGQWDDFWMCALGLNSCVIATAAYGSPMAPEVVYMRNVRDGMIGSTPTGRVLRDAFNTWYYSWSPLVASWISTSGTLRAVFRELLVPIVASVHVAGYVFEGLGGGDFASVIAFSAAAALTIGAYVMLSALPLSCVFWFLRRRISKGTQRRATRWIAGVLLLLIAGSVLAALFALAGAMMIINAAIVLIALLGAGVLMALRIVGLAKRRFHGSLT
jgi:hypothetical protein